MNAINHIEAQAIHVADSAAPAETWWFGDFQSLRSSPDGH